MRPGNLFFSAVQFIFSALIVLLGLFLIGLQYAPHVREAIAQFFSRPTIFLFIGSLIFCLGILLLMGFYSMHRGVFYSVNMRAGKISVDGKIICTYLHDYWKKRFPDQTLAVDVDVSKKKIQLYVELPNLENQEEILKHAEAEFGQILSSQLGYEREFLLSVLVK